MTDNVVNPTLLLPEELTGYHSSGVCWAERRKTTEAGSCLVRAVTSQDQTDFSVNFVNVFEQTFNAEIISVLSSLTKSNHISLLVRRVLVKERF